MQHTREKKATGSPFVRNLPLKENGRGSLGNAVHFAGAVGSISKWQECLLIVQRHVLVFATFICPAAGQGNISVLNFFFFVLPVFVLPFSRISNGETAKGPRGATERGDVRH